MDVVVHVVASPRRNTSITQALVMNKLLTRLKEFGQIVFVGISLASIQSFRQLDDIVVKVPPVPVSAQPEEVLDVA